MRGTKRSLGAVAAWVRRQPPKVKAFLAVVTGMAALVFIRFIVHDHDNLFVAAEAAHALGIAVLIYKLTKEKTCAGSCNPPISAHPRFCCSRPRLDPWIPIDPCERRFWQDVSMAQFVGIFRIVAILGRRFSGTICK